MPGPSTVEKDSMECTLPKTSFTATRSTDFFSHRPWRSSLVTPDAMTQCSSTGITTHIISVSCRSHIALPVTGVVAGMAGRLEVWGRNGEFFFSRDKLVEQSMHSHTINKNSPKLLSRCTNEQGIAKRMNCLDSVCTSPASLRIHIRQDNVMMTTVILISDFTM